jgi:transcriptional regulator with XRE-family HTH domain
MVGKIIRKLRLEKGITQNELSNYLGLTPKMVSFYELGERFPPYDIILKLADYFNVSTDYLLGRSTIKNAEELLTDYSSLSEHSKKDLEEFIQILKLKDLE